MIGGGFQHDVCSSALNANELVEWVKGPDTADISFHIDNSIFAPTNKSKENYGWFCESSAIIPHVIKKVVSNLSEYKKKYRHIFTHDRRILRIDSDFFKFNIPPALPWIQDRQIYNKTKGISFIGSNKRMCKGHMFRQDIITKYEDQVDHFGRGFEGRELPWTIKSGNFEESGKILGLKDYMFSIAMENDNYNDIFCEKTTDCFATGTIPVFWGTRNIGNYFDADGIVFLEDIGDLGILTKEFYESKLEHVENNFRLINNLSSMEDYIFENYLKEGK
jgi:hypothetical protein